MKIQNEEINNNNDFFTHLDKTDFRIVSLLVLGYDNKKISSTLKIPLSTYNTKKNTSNTTVWNSNTRISTRFQIAWYEKRVIAYISS
jgi:FixJ family two-component response regulator